MSIKASVLSRSTSQPVMASPPFATRQGYQIPGIATPGAPQVAATYAAPRTYAAPPMQQRPGYSGFASNNRAIQAEALTPTVYAAAPPPSLTYASPPAWGNNYAREQFVVEPSLTYTSPPTWGNNYAREQLVVEPSLTYASPPAWGNTYAREQLIVEPNGQVDRVYARSPPTTLTYAAPVQEIIEIVRDDSEAIALRAELQECVALVQEYQRKNGELVQVKNDLEVRLSGCEVRNSELQQQNGNQLEEINLLLRRNEELASLNLSLQEKVRELEAHNHKPVHHEKAPPPPKPEPELEGSDDDKIEQLIRAFIRDHPDFPIEVERTKPLWYQFTGPINKKINFKVQGHNILARVGGGFDEARKWLTEQRNQFLEAEGIMVEEERENSAGAGAKGRQLGSHVSRSKRSASGGRNSSNGR